MSDAATEPSPSPSRGWFDRPAPGGAGTRPAAWWKYDAPEPRRVTRGTLPEGSDRDYFGMSRFCYGSVEYEEEADYLNRLDLLTDAEREILEL